MTEVLTNRNFLLFCAKHYDNTKCDDLEDFYYDIKRLKYIKKAFTIFKQSGKIKIRLVLNHFIVLNNVFSSYAIPRMFFLKMEEHKDCFVPFLMLLNIMPDRITNIKKKDSVILLDDIALNQNIINLIRKLINEKA
jgi:hypothetical protein